MVLRRIAEPFFDLLFIRSFFHQEKWQLVKKIGKGSFGTTYLIHRPEEERFYILKRMNFHRLKSPEARSGFQTEIQLLSKLADDAFPALLETGNWRGTPYFIMEYKAGKTFEQLIFSEGQVFTEQESFTIAGRLLGKLTELHELGIIHRDLRIPNVLTDQKHLYIIDFGLACIQVEAPPDLEEDNPRKRVHFTSDLYSLGHFLLFLLYSGYHPVRKKEQTWEEELTLLPASKKIIKKLLMSDPPFENSFEALAEINKHIKNHWE